MPVLDMKLVREPRSLKRMSGVVRKEVRKSYELLARAFITSVHSGPISTWTHKPSFSYKVTVSKRRYTLSIKYDGRTLGGRRFTWVDRGTGQYGLDGGKSYIIKARKKKALFYNLPTAMPKTMAFDGSLAPSYTADEGSVVKNAVRHPGIKPRKLMENEIKLIKSRKSGSFYNVTEAAIKRGLRQMGRHT